MKSERRHELQHNELAEWLAKTAEEIRPYQNLILTVVLVVLVAILGYTLWSRQSAAHASQAWDELSAAIASNDPAKIAKTMEDYPATTAASTAAVVLADSQLAQGCDQLFKSKALAQQELQKAIGLYQTVREESRLESLKERATFGLARAKEALGELEPAGELYQEIVTKWPKGTFTAASQQRLEDLKRPAIKTLYDDLRKFDPKPAFSGEPGERPKFDASNLPKEGAASMPEIAKDQKPDEKAKEPDNAKDGEKKAPD